MLFFVGTPCGNRADITLRALDTLRSLDVLYTEDTRATSMLLAHYDITISHIYPLHKDNEFAQIPRVLADLDRELRVGYVSQAGMPGISDPGMLLLQHVVKRGLPYEIIPGPTAFATALLHWGAPYDRSMFLGFLPKKRSQLVQLRAELAQIRETVFVAYESPLRIVESVAILAPSRYVLCREMTKKFEEVTRNQLPEMIKGEVTVVFVL